MKKDRNAFFSEYGFNNMNQHQHPNMMMPGGNMHNPGAMHNVSGMHGTPDQHHHGGNGPHHTPMPTDVDSRIAKLERAINRLETRVSKLEGDGHGPHHEHEAHFNNSMYMV